MIFWGQATCEALAPPAPLTSLLNRAIEQSPDNAALHVKLACIQLDAYAYEEAAEHLERALQLDRAQPEVVLQLAHSYNGMGRHDAAIDLLGADGDARFERAAAFLGAGREADAEAELSRLLAAQPGHIHGAWQYLKILRRSGRLEELLTTCEDLFARGVRHSQLFYDWGRAAALAGDFNRARALLFTRSRVTEHALPVPAGFADIDSFNDALTEELLTHPAILSAFPAGEANRGSSRIQNLLSGKRPDLIVSLLRVIEGVIGRHVASAAKIGRFDPWFEARPARAHLRAWGLIQQGSAYEDWHLHRGGWISGVYYVRVPACVTARGPGPGCIEFGPPQKLLAQFPELAPVWRHAPKAGQLLLAPSHYSHRTIPSGSDEHRISFAFDMVSDAA